MKIYAVIVTFNRKKLLAECISSIINQNYLPDKIIIVDNNSTDGTYEFIKDYLKDNDNLRYIKLHKNLGGAGGFYYGMNLAYNDGADWIWIMDDDTIPDPSALEELVKSVKIVGKKASYLASNVYGMDKEPMNVPQIKMHYHQNGYINNFEFLQHSLVEIDTATFVSLLINSRAIAEYGLPHKDFFIWGDDTEYTARIVKHFGKAYLVGKSLVLHKRINSTSLSFPNENNKMRIAMMKYSYRNTLVYYKYYGTKKQIYKFELNMIKDIVKIILQKKHKIKKISQIIIAYYEFVFGKYNKKGFKNRFTNTKKVSDYIEL